MKSETFGQTVRTLRIEKNIGSRQLARLIEKAETYISQLERGQIKTTDYNTGYQILNNLNVDPDKIDEVLAYYNIYPTNKPNKERGIFGEILDELQYKDGEALMEFPPVKESDEINEKLAKECIAKLESFSDSLHPIIKSNPQLAMPVIEKMEEMANTLFKDVTKVAIKRMLVDEDKSNVLLAAMEEMIKEMKSKQEAEKD